MKSEIIVLVFKAYWPDYQRTGANLIYCIYASQASWKFKTEQKGMHAVALGALSYRYIINMIL